MSREYLIGIDIGTASIRVALLDLGGRVLAIASTPQAMDVPRPGWAEQDARLWWSATASGIRQVLDRAKVRPAEVIAVGADAQMHATIPLDAAGQPIPPRVPIWCDKRATQLVRAFEGQPFAHEASRIAADPPLAAWVGFKMAWFKEHEPALYERTWKFATGAAFVNYMLSGELAMDWSEASGSFLFDATTLAWSDQLAGWLGVSLDKMPPVVESTCVIGEVTEAAASATGLTVGTPVVAGAGDMQCMLLAAGMAEEGTAVDITGTASDFCVFSREPIIEPPTMNLHHAIAGWIPFGIAESGGGALQWFRDQLRGAVEASGPCGIAYDRLDELAKAVPPGADGLLFLPYLMGERLLGSPMSRAAFVGLTPSSGTGVMARAIMEGVCFELKRTLEIAEGTGTNVRSIFTTGGGARSSLWSQIKADIYERPVQTVVASEGGVVGSALLAAAGVGAIPSVSAGVERWVVRDRTFQPEPARFPRYERLYEVFKQIHDRLQEPFERLALIP